MAIDAVIERIRQVPEGLRLELAPRVDRDGSDTCPGQSCLLLDGPRSVEPQVGMEIWGGADFCELVDRDPYTGVVRGTLEYSRKGTSALRERKRCHSCYNAMYWAVIREMGTGRLLREVFRCGACSVEQPLD